MFDGLQMLSNTTKLSTIKHDQTEPIKPGEWKSKNMTLIFSVQFIIIRFGFCDIQNNRGLGKGLSAEAEPYLDLDYSGYHKTLIQ